MTTEENYFNELYSVNVNGKTEEKNGLTYLSWAWAWAEFCKRYPDANYEVVKFNGLPYVYDDATGYIVYTKVTILGVTREMWLAVMDSNNYAMKKESYKVVTKYKTIDVKPATMTDINKTIMRCLTKNLAMFGLGLYIYAGEDLPEDATESATAPTEPTETTKSKSKSKAKASTTEATTAPTEATTEPTGSTESTTKPKHTVRAEFVEYCKKYGIKDAKFTDICKHFKLNNEAKDENFIKALEYCKQMVENDRRKALAESKSKPKTEVDEALEETEEFLNGIEEV